MFTPDFGAGRDRPALRERLVRFGARALHRKAEHEAAKFDDAPRLGVTMPWSNGRRAHGSQTLRAFIQINVLPRPR